MILTNWGYTLTDASEIPMILSEGEFNRMTASKYAGDVRIEAELKAAQSAIRNYVGWHLSGNLTCECRMIPLDKRLTIRGTDILIQLPARYVTEVSKATIGGSEVSNLYCDPSGILRLFDAIGSLQSRSTEILIDYKAGIDDAMADPVKDIIMHRVTHALANSYGIQSESSGGVSVTYSANWINTSRATALADDNKEVLEPYRLQGVF